MSSIRYHEAADEELLDAVGYLELRQRGLGRRLLAEIRRAEEFILRFPEGSPEIRPGVRKKLVRTFNYLLLYSLEPEGPFVLAVAHYSRRPDYWFPRTEEADNRA